MSDDNENDEPLFQHLWGVPLGQPSPLLQPGTWEIGHLLTYLGGDILYADRQVRRLSADSQSAQFYRRAYLQLLFTYFEAMCAQMRRLIRGSHRDGHWVLNDRELAFLKASDTRKGLPLQETIKRTIEILERKHGHGPSSGIGVTAGSHGSAKFVKSIELRHGVTHPKKLEDIALDDSQMEICRGAYKWFRERVSFMVGCGDLVEEVVDLSRPTGQD